MLALLDQGTHPVVADDAEAAIAKVAAEKLRRLAQAKSSVKITVQDDPKIVVPLPAIAVRIVVQMLRAMGEQKPFSIIPHEAELTTQQAADYLNVSRPFLTKLIDGGTLKARLVGRHRRVRFSDLRDYEAKSRTKSRAALGKLAAEAQRLRLEDE